MKIISIILFLSLVALGATVHRVDNIIVRENGTTTQKMTIEANATEATITTVNDFVINSGDDANIVTQGQVLLDASATANIVKLKSNRVEIETTSGTPPNQFGVLTTPRHSVAGSGITQNMLLESGRINAAGAYGTTGGVFIRSGELRDGAGDVANLTTTGNLLVESGRARSSSLDNSLVNTGTATFGSGPLETGNIGATGTVVVQSGSINSGATGDTGNVEIKSGTTSSGTRGYTYLDGLVTILDSDSTIYVLAQQASDPVDVTAGQIYYNTTDNKFRYSDGVQYANMSGDINTDETVKVSANDTTAGYLNGKLVAGTNITLVENNDGANETLTINASGGGVSIGDAIGNSPTAFGFLYADGAGNLGNDDSYKFSGTGPTNVNLTVGAASFADSDAKITVSGFDNAKFVGSCNNSITTCETGLDLTDSFLGTGFFRQQNGNTTIGGNGQIFISPTSANGTGDVVLTGDLRINNQSGTAAFIEFDSNNVTDTIMGVNSSGNFYVEQQGGTTWLQRFTNEVISFNGSEQVQFNNDGLTIYSADVNGAYLNLDTPSNTDFRIEHDAATNFIMSYNIFPSFTEIPFFQFDATPSTGDITLTAQDDIVLRPIGDVVDIVGTGGSAYYRASAEGAGNAGIIFTTDTPVQQYQLESLVTTADFRFRDNTSGLNLYFYDKSADTAILQTTQTAATVPAIMLRPASSADDFWVAGDGSLYAEGFSAIAGSNDVRWSSVTGELGYLSSDARIKKDITTLSGAVDALMCLRAVRFKWKSELVSTDFPDRNDHGFIAQEVKNCVPDIVFTEQDTGLYWTVAYEKLVPTLVAGFQDHEDRLLALEGKQPKEKFKKITPVDYTKPIYEVESGKSFTCTDLADCRAKRKEYCSEGYNPTILEVAGALEFSCQKITGFAE